MKRPIRRGTSRQSTVRLTITDREGTVIDAFKVFSDRRLPDADDEAIGSHAAESLLIARIKRALSTFSQ